MRWRECCLPPRTTEKTKNVLEQPEAPAPENAAEPTSDKTPGHGRNGASSYTGAKKVAVPHPKLHAGDSCPDCLKGKVYPQKEPRALVRIVGQAPLAATVYELDRLRCNFCGDVFTAQEPEGIGAEKYDETTAAMIALLKYGSGMPFYRLERLEELLGIPLPASTQWEIVEEAAELIQTAPRRTHPPGGARRSTAQRRYQHAGAAYGARTLRRPHRCVHHRHRVHQARTQESRCTLRAASTRAKICAMCCNTAQRSSAAPIQMCDALSRNTPKLMTASRSCWRTVWRMEDGSLWKWRELPEPVPLCAGVAGQCL